MARPLQCDTVSEQLFVGMHPESQHLEGTVQKIPPTNYKLNQYVSGLKDKDKTEILILS